MIEQRYTLFTRIPIYVESSRLYTDPLWAKDLLLHLEYIRDFHLCCPVEEYAKAPDKVVELQQIKVSQVHPLRRDHGYFSVLLNLIPNFMRVFNAARKTRIAHSGGAGWFFPLSFYLLLIKPFLNFQWVVVIESSFWMKPVQGKASFRQRIRHSVYRVLLRSCLASATARVFTTNYYRLFFRMPEQNSLVAPAVWINEDDIISNETQRDRLAALSVGTVKMIFPARMVAHKGLELLINAIQQADTMLDENDPRIEIDLIGQGELAETCRAFVSRFESRIQMRFLDPVAYGTPFFELLQNYHAVLLANRHSEQPRVVLDAFSQGVPVISSDTDGVKEITKDGENALLYPNGNAMALAETILRFVRDQALRSTLCENALAGARGLSHSAMHRTRCQFLQEHLDCKH